MRTLLALLAALAAGFPGAADAQWSSSVDERHGLPIVARGGGAAVSSNFAFWGQNWAWANMQTRFSIAGPLEYSVMGRNPALNLELNSRIKTPSSHQRVWEFDLNARNAAPGVIGGGIVFKFDLATFGRELGEPELLPGHRGWAWGRAGATRLEMRFEPALAEVYFERGQKNEVRAFFYKGDVPQGARRYVATLNVSRDVAFAPTTVERFGGEDRAAWPTDILDWRTSPVDLSFLNAGEKPAGKRGFVKVAGDALVFADGTPARFWGTNLTAYALFGTTRDNVRQQARRLSELGFNLVRLHHHDSPWVSPNVFGERGAPDTQSLDSAMLEKLDWWIKCLKDEGIYVWLDLHVGRQMKPGDRIDGFEEIAKGKPLAELKGYSYVNPSIQQAMKRFNEAYVNHVNAHTGNRYKDEPAIVAMLITNENDLTQHYGNALLPDKNVPKHNALYMAQAEAFAAKRGLASDRIWRSWEHGPAKLFLNDLERRFNADMIAHLRALGVKVPLVTTSTWGLAPLSALPALTAGGIVDVHSYGGVGELEKNPLHSPNLVHWIAAARVAGKPLSVTEWNVEAYPAPDRHGVALYVAAAASHQGWHALMQYAYAQVPLNGPGNVSNWHAYNDPAAIAMLPAGALLYRQAHVQEARVTYVFAPTSEQLFDEVISPLNSPALRTAVEKGKLVIALPQAAALPWLEKSPLPAAAKMLSEPKQAQIATGDTEAVSDTGELTRNWEQGVYLVNTPRSQGATGWISKRPISLPDLEIRVSTGNASVMAQSLDGRPLRDSRRILVSLGARAVPAGPQQLPFYAEPVLGQLALRAPEGLRAYRRDAAGTEQPVPTGYRDGRYQITLDRSLRTYWLTLK